MSKMIDGNALIMILTDWWYSTFREEETEESKAIKTVVEEVEKYVDGYPTYRGWIPVSERLPEEHEWIGTKLFGTTMSDTILMTFDVDGTRFVKPMSLQNGKLSGLDAQTMDAFYKGWKMIAWMPLPDAYREDGEE